jgi:hypothetical protein
VPCVSCLVIGITPADLASPPQLAPGSLDGLLLLVPGTPRGDEIVDFMQALAVTGAAVGVLIAPSTGSSIQQIVFEARTTITALRAEKPDLQVVLDGDAFAATGVDLDVLTPYVDAVVRGPKGSAPLAAESAPLVAGSAPLRPSAPGWLRVPSVKEATVNDLVAASLTPGGERVLLPVDHIDWRVLQEFAARRPTLVEVTGSRRLTVGEILARYQAQQRRHDAIVRTTVATGTTTLLFEVPDFAAPITITAGTTIFRGPGGINIEERDIRVNGAAITGGGAQSPPQLPLIEAERISTPPLAIALDEAYRYALDGEVRLKPGPTAIDKPDPTAADAGSRCYVVSFEPRVPGRGLARGRAWIDVGDFTLRRLETIQRDLRGAIVSSEEVDEFGRVDVAGAAIWLPVEARIFQSYEGAGFRTPIHRTITVQRYDVNSATFDAELAAALASDNVMMQDTPDGLRYLVRRGSGGGSRSVATRGGHSIRSIIGGVLVDPNISRPLAFAGLSYVNLDLFGRGAQVNLFFGGVFGQASWTLPSIAGTRWQAHGSGFAIAAQYTDRVFRNGREQYAEELLQQPAYISAGVLRPLTPRVRATLDYSLDVTGLERTVNTPALFEVPLPIVNHGARLAIDADRGAWSLRGWWNPVVRHRWRSWGLPGPFDLATRSYQRYGARLTRTLALRTSVSSRIEMSWMAGHDLDRFSRYGFDSFDNQLHGYPTASIRYDRGAIVRSATAWSRRGVRVDAFGDAAVVHDPGWASAARVYPGVGVGVESGGPFRTLLSVEWAYGIRAPRSDGGRGTQTARITVYRGF